MILEKYKPTKSLDYIGHFKFVNDFKQRLKQNDFKDLTFFGQDWGGLIGLRMVAADPDRFLRVAVGNTGLPYNPDVDQEVIEKVHTFRASKKKYSIFKMWQEVSRMNKKSIAFFLLYFHQKIPDIIKLFFDL